MWWPLHRRISLAAECIITCCLGDCTTWSFDNFFTQTTRVEMKTNNTALKGKSFGNFCLLPWRKIPALLLQSLMYLFLRTVIGAVFCHSTLGCITNVGDELIEVNDILMVKIFALFYTEWLINPQTSQTSQGKERNEQGCWEYHVVEYFRLAGDSTLSKARVSYLHASFCQSAWKTITVKRQVSCAQHLLHRRTLGLESLVVDNTCILKPCFLHTCAWKRKENMTNETRWKPPRSRAE